jgi:hypothetical protein
MSARSPPASEAGSGELLAGPGVPMAGRLAAGVPPAVPGPGGHGRGKR